MRSVNDDDGSVRVNAIYEPPQTGNTDSISLERGTAEERSADAIAAAQGWKKVGWIYSQSTKEREFIVSTEELSQMAACQASYVSTVLDSFFLHGHRHHHVICITFRAG